MLRVTFANCFNRINKQIKNTTNRQNKKLFSFHISGTHQKKKEWREPIVKLGVNIKSPTSTDVVQANKLEMMKSRPTRPVFFIYFFLFVCNNPNVGSESLIITKHTHTSIPYSNCAPYIYEIIDGGEVDVCSNISEWKSQHGSVGR